MNDKLCVFVENYDIRVFFVFSYSFHENLNHNSHVHWIYIDISLLFEKFAHCDHDMFIISIIASTNKERSDEIDEDVLKVTFEYE